MDNKNGYRVGLLKKLLNVTGTVSPSVPTFPSSFSSHFASLHKLYFRDGVLHIVCEHSVLLYWTICLQGPFLLLIHLLPIHEANPRPLSCLLCNVTSLFTLLISSSSQSRRTIFISSPGAGSQLCLWGGWTPHVTRDELLLVSSCGSRSCKRGVFAQRFIICRALSSTLSHLVFKTSLQAWYYYHYLIYKSLEATAPA